MYNKARIIAEHAKTGSELFITGRLDRYTYEAENKKTVDDDISINCIASTNLYILVFDKEY